MACCQGCSDQTGFGAVPARAVPVNDAEYVYLNYAKNNPLVQVPVMTTAQPQTHWVLWLAVAGAAYYYWKHNK